MVLKVRVDVPLVWRSPSSLQFGVDAPLAVLDDLNEGTERIVAALVSGISRSGFDMMARSLGLDPDSAEALLDRLDPVLEGQTLEGQTPGGQTPEGQPRVGEPRVGVGRVAVTGSGPLADELRLLLADQGVLADPDASEPDIAVIVAGWLVGAEDHGRWLRRDIPHLPVVVGDAGVTVGPFVEPGTGPCLYCVQLTMTDEDAAWPAIATQLWSRPAPALGHLGVVEAAAFTARRVQERLRCGADGVSIRASRYSTPKNSRYSTPKNSRYSTRKNSRSSTSTGEGASSWRLATASGELSSRVWTRHAECRCATPAESDWAPAADRANRSATRRAAADAVLA